MPDTLPILLCLNGDLVDTLPFLDRGDYQKVLATDGAVDQLLDADWTPDLVLGDFDSASLAALGKARRAGAEIISAPSQDATDFEKALEWVADQGITRIDVIGHAGRRLDHTLGNLSAATRHARDFTLRFHDPIATALLRRKGEEWVIEGAAGRTCSVIAISASRVTLEGFQWPLSEELLGGETPQSISNVVTADPARVAVHQGTVLIYLHR